jgi:hypothetical protein
MPFRKDPSHRRFRIPAASFPKKHYLTIASSWRAPASMRKSVESIPEVAEAFEDALESVRGVATSIAHVDQLHRRRFHLEWLGDSETLKRWTLHNWMKDGRPINDSIPIFFPHYVQRYPSRYSRLHSWAVSLEIVYQCARDALSRWETCKKMSEAIIKAMKTDSISVGVLCGGSTRDYLRRQSGR